MHLQLNLKEVEHVLEINARVRLGIISNTLNESFSLMSVSFRCPESRTNKTKKSSAECFRMISNERFRTVRELQFGVLYFFENENVAGSTCKGMVPSFSLPKLQEYFQNIKFQ